MDSESEKLLQCAAGSAKPRDEGRMHSEIACVGE